jgi:hypothetical protein
MGKRGPKSKYTDGISAQLRWYRRHRKRILAALRAANPKEKKKSQFAEEVMRELSQSMGHGFRVCSRSQVDKPPLKYIDAKGRVWVEEEKSAGDLIREWKRKERKKKCVRER